MNYTLMHKYTPVAEIELDAAADIVSVGRAAAPEHVPVGVPVKKGEIDRTALKEWWKGRAIPASRAGIRGALEELGVASTQQLLDKCLGLSLSDQYWICPENAAVTWDMVNFFDNPFSDDVGNILFGKGSSGENISLMSPNNTSDGWLKKKWQIIGGARCLIKGGSGATQQEPYNEVLASAVMRRLHIPHVPYTLTTQEEYPYSVCGDFITPETELISAWYVMQTQKKPNHVSVYGHFLNCCETLGIPGAADFLDWMMTLDYLIVNEDRHQNNFGVVRNAKTLNYIGMAPVYDSGSSLWFSTPTALIRPAAPKQPCKPFKTNHEEQIKLVRSFDWLDFSALKGIDEEFREIVKDSVFIDVARRDALCYALNKRIEMLEEHVRSHTRYTAAADTQADVEIDEAYSGDDEDEPEI